MTKHIKILILFVFAFLLLPTHATFAQSGAQMRNYPTTQIAPPGAGLSTTNIAPISNTSAVPTDDSFDRNVKKNLNPDGSVPLAHQLFQKRIEAAMERFSQLIERINSRIKTVKADGGNTSIAEKHVAQAQTYITTVRTTVNTWVAQRSEKTKEPATRVRAIDIRLALQNIRTELLLAIQALKVDRDSREKTETPKTGNVITN